MIHSRRKELMQYWELLAAFFIEKDNSKFIWFFLLPDTLDAVVTVGDCRFMVSLLSRTSRAKTDAR